MAASYPAGFDTMSDPSTNLSGPPLHSTMHNQINDVIEAIEAELGINPSGSYATVAAFLAALPAVPTAWTNVQGGIGFTNSWVNLDAGRQVQYRKVGDEVELRGAMKSGTLSATAFTLPAGFRPFQTDDTFVVSSGAAAVGTITILASGAVQLLNGSNTFAYLSGIHFSTVA